MNMGASTIGHDAARGLCQLNENLAGLECLECGAFYTLDDRHIDSGLGCKHCLQKGFPVSLACKFKPGTTLIADQKRAGMFRFANYLPFVNFPSLGEGNTSLVRIESLAASMGVDMVAIKNEGQNPTGSHKDRMSPLAVARAMAAGYKKVIASSSGNAGASLASYAARAGLDCCIIAAPDISAPWAEAIKLAGAELRLIESEERWPVMQALVQQDGWFPITNFHPQPISSNPFGIEGYKTIAYEIVEQTVEVPPTVIVVPTCRGDLLYGLYKGFVEAAESGLLKRVPRLVAVEPGKRLELVLSGADYRSVFEVGPNNMVSIDGGTATYQSMKALQQSGGTAVSVDSDEVILAQHELARNGFHVEKSSAASLAGLRQLKAQGKLMTNDRVILIATSHGYKELSRGSQTLVSRSYN